MVQKLPTSHRIDFFSHIGGSEHAKLSLVPALKAIVSARNVLRSVDKRS
jgi:hypothetical protein